MAGFSFDSTLGAASIGFSVSCVVFGVLSTQVFTYFQRYPSDRPAYKILVRFAFFAVACSATQQYAIKVIGLW